MSIDPRMRLVCLVVFGAGVATGTPGAVLIGASLVGCGYILTRDVQLAAAWRMVKRMRWLFLSIIVFYFWFTPGHGIGAVASPWSPTMEGVQQGLLRVLALVTLVLAVNLLLQTTSREALLTALLWVLSPLRRIGFSYERFAVRMMLVLDAVPRVQTLYQRDAVTPGTLRERVAALADGFGALFGRVIAGAERQSLEPIQIESATALNWPQWLIPIGLAGIFALASSVGNLG